MDEPKSIPNAKAIADAYEACTQIARAHYENFPVGRLVPKEMQPHVHAVYAFARYADDLADEGYAGSGKAKGKRDVMTPEERLAALEDWERQLCSPPGDAGVACYFHRPARDDPRVGFAALAFHRPAFRVQARTW